MTAELEVAQNLNSHLASTNDLAMREIIISLINYDLKGKKVQPMPSMDIHKVSAVIVKNKFDEFAEDSGGRHDKDTVMCLQNLRLMIASSVSMSFVMKQLLTNLRADAEMEACRELCCRIHYDKNSAIDETTESNPLEDDEHRKLERFEKTVKEKPPDKPSVVELV